jgi:hypothetical protein
LPVQDSPIASSATQPPLVWLNEGVAYFLSTLWVEKQHDRDTALRILEADRAALALAEPASPGESAGQPLAVALSPVYYRTKAAYVLWMLRDLAGDPALSAALRAHATGSFAPGGSFTGKPSAMAPTAEAGSARSAFEKLLEAAGNHDDLSWFFADWVDADKGLPDLSIEGVFPTSASAGNWLVAVNVANSGYVATEVPVTVRSGFGSSARAVTQRLRIPARGKASQRLLIQGKPTEVQINDGVVPETQASVHLTKLDDAASGGSSQTTPQ